MHNIKHHIDENGVEFWYDDDAEEALKTRVLFINRITFYSFCLHRDDGPALIWTNEKEEYYINGMRHRDDGPAIITYSNGNTRWFLDNKECLFENWCKKLNKTEEEINFLKLKWNINE